MEVTVSRSSTSPFFKPQAVVMTVPACNGIFAVLCGGSGAAAQGVSGSSAEMIGIPSSAGAPSPSRLLRLPNIPDTSLPSFCAGAPGLLLPGLEAGFETDWVMLIEGCLCLLFCYTHGINGTGDTKPDNDEQHDDGNDQERCAGRSRRERLLVARAAGALTGAKAAGGDGAAPTGGGAAFAGGWGAPQTVQYAPPATRALPHTVQ